MKLLITNIYSLHEYGAPSHLYALDYLAKSKSMQLYHREFGFLSQAIELVKRPSLEHLVKPFINFGFLASLPFTSGKSIVLGIAPYNFMLYFLLILLRPHKVYYFTSYTCWDQSRFAHNAFYSPSLLKIWKEFTSRTARHIFAVSQKTCDELVANGFSSRDRITVVYHSYREKVCPPKTTTKTNTFIYAGRMVRSKGIDQLIEIFSKRQDSKLMLIGEGAVIQEAKQAAAKYQNIRYLAYVNGFKNLIPFYCENSFLVLNSQRMNNWEELFGLVIIEAMACGLVPIATDHSGPREIITSFVDGIICKEGHIAEGVDYARGMRNDDYLAMRAKSISRASEFTSALISKRWEAIIDK